MARLLATPLLLAAPLLAACAPSEDTTTNIIDSTPIPTSIMIDPYAFLEGTVCADLPGAMRSYVATVIDEGPKVDAACTSNECVGNGVCEAQTEDWISSPEDCRQPFPLPSSAATACSQRVQFRYVLTGHVYTANIEAYEQGPDELVPLGGPSSGNPTMRARCHPECPSDPGCDANCGQPIENGKLCDPCPIVEPRWKTGCGAGGFSAASFDVAVVVEPCAPLEDSAPSPTSIRVRPADALGSLSCGLLDDQVATFDIAPFDPSLDLEPGMACGKSAVKEYTENLLPGLEYRFEIYAYEGANPAVARWSTTCFATALPGVTVTAFCDPLVEIGSP